MCQKVPFSSFGKGQIWAYFKEFCNSNAAMQEQTMIISMEGEYCSIIICNKIFGAIEF